MVRSINTSCDVSLYELLKLTQYSNAKNFPEYIPKLPVLTTEEGIKQIKNNLNKISEWRNLFELIPNFYIKNKMEKTGIAGIFAASLELIREGTIKVSQKKNL